MILEDTDGEVPNFKKFAWSVRGGGWAGDDNRSPRRLPRRLSPRLCVIHDVLDCRFRCIAHLLPRYPFAHMIIHLNALHPRALARWCHPREREASTFSSSISIILRFNLRACPSDFEHTPAIQTTAKYGSSVLCFDRCTLSYHASSSCQHAPINWWSSKWLNLLIQCIVHDSYVLCRTVCNYFILGDVFFQRRWTFVNGTDNRKTESVPQKFDGSAYVIGS